MRHFVITTIFLFSFLLIFPQNIKTKTTPALLIGQGDQLSRIKKELAAGNPDLVAALKTIVEKADASLEKPIVNVVDEGALPPSGDAHDYFSYSPYWWPDPENPDGPYIWRDGVTNPDRRTSDVSRLEAMGRSVTSLVPAWYFTGDERYAERAVQQIRAWYLNPQTRMDPNFRFGQKRRGHDYNSSGGILESNRMDWVVDCAILLEEFSGWTDKDQTELRNWFGELATWMVESPEGIEEAMQPNNHGAWYNYHLILYSLYGEKPEIARSHLDLMPARIFGQVFIDGRQPQELIRTNALSYSIYGARALTGVARLGRHLDYDLFAYRSTEGRSIRLAIDYITPFILGEKEWPGDQIRSISSSRANELYWNAALGFDEREFADILNKLPGNALPSPIVQLLDPLPKGW